MAKKLLDEPVTMQISNPVFYRIAVHHPDMKGVKMYIHMNTEKITSNKDEAVLVHPHSYTYRGLILKPSKYLYSLEPNV